MLTDMTAPAELIMINLDSPDPVAHAEFYRQLLDGEITHSEPAYTMLRTGTTTIGFELVDGYQPPAWPDTAGAKRYHLDLYVDDLAEAEELFVAAGATRPDFQPGAGRWVVLTDPAGQPFCICPRPQG
ncbi:VOC family protein [Micromonospora sp. CPCC 206060]|uniref:VOC family protein n=1 Tax=Micromonospora sp. CPCC 206060 TaxID=3122406 RepID=UPI002FF25702